MSLNNVFDVFCSFVSRYFDAYQDNKLRELIERKIKILETNILAINNPSVRIGLLQAVAMIDQKFYGIGAYTRHHIRKKIKVFLINSMKNIDIIILVIS